MMFGRSIRTTLSMVKETADRQMMMRNTEMEQFKRQGLEATLQPNETLLQRRATIAASIDNIPEIVFDAADVIIAARYACQIAVTYSIDVAGVSHRTRSTAGTSRAVSCEYIKQHRD